MSTRLSLKENILIRLVGLFVAVAPNRGFEFLMDIGWRTVEDVTAELKSARTKDGGTSLVA